MAVMVLGPVILSVSSIAFPAIVPRPEGRAAIVAAARIAIRVDRVLAAVRAAVAAVPGAPAAGGGPAGADAAEAVAVPVAGHADAIVAVAALAGDCVAPGSGPGPGGARPERTATKDGAHGLGECGDGAVQDGEEEGGGDGGAHGGCAKSVVRKSVDWPVRARA
ncbi:hypothetical protein DFH11DRAFT_414087 [Phellopilus nigrolimitatus]|nr:hypothetical protein DFH11DRAFT_414087 [Phellopilus nigrolimitatus]